MIDTSDSIEIYDRSRKSWTEDEDNILIKLVKKYGVKRWTDISKAMADFFELTNKSGKQCRERWVNHLDPKINKNKWTIGEERKIFDSHKIYGNKWKIIAKQLDNRTDNSIKNHFYSILRKGLRRINKMMGDRKSTEKVKQIRTSVLSKLDKLEHQSSEQNKKINISSIYELLFQFSSMSSGNISEKNLTHDLKEDFKEIITHLMSLSCQQKMKKELNVAINKDKRNRRNSASLNEESQEPMQQESEQIQNQRVIQIQNQDEKDVKTGFQLTQKQLKFLVPIAKPEKPKEMTECEKYLVEEKTSQKAFSLINLIQQTPHKAIGLMSNSERHQQNELVESQKGEDFNLFPNITINLDEQSANMSFTHSNDFNLNCFNKSPLFHSSRMIDHFNIRTPRVPSPGAFNFCGPISTAQSLGNYAALTSKDGYEQKSTSFDNQLQKIVQQLRSNIDANCNTISLGGNLRVNSSRNCNIEPCLKTNSCSSFLTPKSGSGKAH